MQTVEGAKKAVRTILKKNPNHFVEAGRLGGLKKVPKGFAMNHELAVKAGARAGKLSKIGHKYIETKRGYSCYLAKDTGKVVKYKHDSTNKRQTSND